MKNLEDLPESYVDEFYTKVGMNVKKIRESKGITQLQLSQALGFRSVGLVSQAEIYLNKQHFNLKHLAHIAFLLECDINDFFRD